MIAISTDDKDTARKFKQSLKAPFHFVADESGALVRRYEVKAPVINYSTRTTFVVGAGRRIIAKHSGSEALDPSGAVAACSLDKPESLKSILGPDGGR